LTTEEDDSKVMEYFWKTFIKKNQDEETTKLCKYMLDNFAVDSFHWFLRTTEEKLIE
jgi:hypothetical protein